MPLLRRALGMVVGYQVHRLLTLRLAPADAPPTLPDGLALALLHQVIAMVVAGYLATLVAGSQSTRTARLLGIALAAVAILAMLQRADQGLRLLTPHVAQLVAAPTCALGAVLVARHRQLWTRRRQRRPPDPPGRAVQP